MVATMRTAGRYERQACTRAEAAAAIGISTRHYRRLLAQERERAATIDDQCDRSLPFVELVDGQSRRRYHYRLDDDRLSQLPLCPFRIGTGRGRYLQVEHHANAQSDPRPRKCAHAFRPKRPRKSRDVPS
jgi:hypothetical protein